jgi:hypothetical protein
MTPRTVNVIASMEDYYKRFGGSTSHTALDRRRRFLSLFAEAPKPTLPPIRPTTNSRGIR